MDLGNIMHVLVGHNSIHKPLQPLYDSPYCFLKRTDKHYMLEVVVRPEVVLLDCLKPAYLQSNLLTDINASTQVAIIVQPTKSPVTITRSSGCVHRPVCFI